MQINCICAMMPNMKEEMERILRKSDLKVTKERMLLLELLISAKKPLSIEDIESQVKGKVNMTTIYRILEKFNEKGLVYKAYFGTGKAFFEYQDKHHHHVTCTTCGEQEKIDMCVSKEKVSKQLKKFASVNNHVLEFFGTCKNCA